MPQLREQEGSGLEAASSGHVHGNMAAHRCSEKGKAKQLEKEMPWGMIQPDEKDLFRAAEEAQWQEHLHYRAVRPLSLQESADGPKRAHPTRPLCIQGQAPCPAQARPFRQVQGKGQIVRSRTTRPGLGQAGHDGGCSYGLEAQCTASLPTWACA